MGAQKTATMKNKHAGPKATGGAKGAKRSGPGSDGPASKSKKPTGTIMSKQITKNSAVPGKKKKKVYTEKELGIPALNMITPVGVVKPKGKKKGKVFVDDNEGMNTIMAMVQAEQNGQIESKMIKARQMEQIREARKAEETKKYEERQERLEEKKASLRKKRNKKTNLVNDTTDAQATKKRVSFA